MSDFITKTECEIRTENMQQDIDKAFILIRDNTRELNALNKETAGQSVTLRHLEETLSKLDITLTKLVDAFIDTDKDTAVKTALNSNNIVWNGKNILAAGTVITFLVAIVLTFISNMVTG